MGNKYLEAFLSLLLFCLFCEAQTGYRQSYELSKQADYRVTYSTNDGRFDIGIGVIEGNTWKNKQLFSFEQLKSYFKNQKHKNMILVTVSKNTLKEETLGNLISKINKYFLGVGYQRVVIHQASGGTGMYILSDERQNL